MVAAARGRRPAKPERPWLAEYNPGSPSDVEQRFSSLVEMFQQGHDRFPDNPLVLYFGRTLTVAEIGQAADQLAAALADLGVRKGDRVAHYQQNVPQFVISMLAVWKLGAIVVPVNPMHRERELRLALDDSESVVLICLESLYEDVARHAVPGSSVKTVITTSELDFAEDPTGPLRDSRKLRPSDTIDLVELLQKFEGQRPPEVEIEPDDLALLTYTSGTTGPPKAAMNTHRNALYSCEIFKRWMRLDENDVLLAAAPLFHITGLIAHVAIALAVPLPLVLFFRFDATTAAQMIERHQVTFTVASITAFVAMLNEPEVAKYDMSSLTKAFSGGAPIAPGVVDDAYERLGFYIYSSFGMTETTSGPSHATPLGKRARADTRSNTLSIGIPVSSTVARVVDDTGVELPAGEVGEIVISGPQVVSGYWRNDEETRNAFVDGEICTGDIGYRDEDGWFYIVDRKKDQINVSGFKVWPQEVERVLALHPAVLEAAVVGVADDYRGEVVKAVVVPRGTADPDELIRFCRDQLAVYKCPRVIDFVDELPKSASGKVLKRTLSGTDGIGHAAAIPHNSDGERKEKHSA